MMRKSLRLTVAILVAALGVLAFGATAALADSPHFLKASASVDSTGNLICTFKEAGLGTTVSTTNITCSAAATAVYACINGGGNHPKATNKETVSGPVSGGGSFPVRNGQTTGSITVGPPGAGDFSCPNGQDLVLASVCYADVTLTGEGGDTITATPNTACRTFFNV
jgi:hypothetical protein